MSRTNEVEQACRRGASMRGSIADAATLAAEVERLEVELDALRAIPGGDTEIYVLDDGSHVTGNRAAELLDDEKTRSERAIGEREEQRQRAEAAEARLAELEAQYACKRHHGEEALGAAAQLTDDMLRSCQICGLTVDLSKGHCEPTIEFTMQGRTDKKAKKLAELEAQNARLREALEEIARYDRGSPHGDGICPFGCDTPHLAKQALADGKAAP